MKRSGLGLLILLACPPGRALAVDGEGAAALPPSATAAAWVDEGRRSFEAAPLTAAAAALEACAREDEEAFGCAFQAARARLFLTYVYELAGDRKAALACLDPALRWAAEAVARRPGSAAAHALLGDVYGRKILLGNVFTAMRYGPKSAAEVDAAVRLDPDDPGVLAAEGRRYLYAPSAFGGDLDKARSCLERSLAAGDSDSTRYFLALTLRKAGQADRARRELLKAQAMNPANGLVRVALARTP